MLSPETVRGRSVRWCVARLGDIPAGAYHVRVPYIGEAGRAHLRMHLQCRDVCDRLGLYGERVVSDLDQDQERGPEWVAHHRAVAEWAAGGAYKRE